MASANLDLVRSICAAWERGDYGSAEWADPEIDYAWANGPWEGSWTGLRAMGRVWREFLNAWEDYRIEVVEYRQLDADRVAALFQPLGRGKTSGLELGQMPEKGVAFFTLGGGKVTALTLYWPPLSSRDLAELGLAPDAGSSPS